MVSFATLLACTLDSLVRVSRRVGRSRCVKRPERVEGEVETSRPPTKGGRALSRAPPRSEDEGGRSPRAVRTQGRNPAPPSRRPFPPVPTDADPPGRRMRSRLRNCSKREAAAGPPRLKEGSTDPSPPQVANWTSPRSAGTQGGSLPTPVKRIFFLVESFDRFPLNNFKHFGLSFQSSLHLSLTVLVRYRSLARI